MKVLLVDDSRVMRKLIRRTLRHAGYALDVVQEAGDGGEALEVLGRFAPDLVLSDWNMPGMGGFELLQTMKENGIGVPLGFVTSESTPEMRAKAIAEGARFLLTKPFTSENVRMALGEAGFQASGAFTQSTAAPDVLRPDAPPSGFDERALADTLTQLINCPVSAAPGPRLTRTTTPCVTARWVDDDGVLLYAGFFELKLAVAVGAAMGLRPPGTLSSLLKAGRLPDELHADTREVLNVLSRCFNDAGSDHTLFAEAYFPPARPPIDVIKLDRKPLARRDYKVTLEGYGEGRLSIVSIDPSFIVARAAA